MRYWLCSITMSLLSPEELVRHSAHHVQRHAVMESEGLAPARYGLSV
jgi:hypothetical protein